MSKELNEEEPLEIVSVSQLMEGHVRLLINRAADTADAGESMKFSQSALNAANAMIALDHIRRELPEE